MLREGDKSGQFRRRFQIGSLQQTRSEMKTPVERVTRFGIIAAAARYDQPLRSTVTT